MFVLPVLLAYSIIICTHARQYNIQADHDLRNRHNDISPNVRVITVKLCDYTDMCISGNHSFQNGSADPIGRHGFVIIPFRLMLTGNLLTLDHAILRIDAPTHYPIEHFYVLTQDGDREYHNKNRRHGVNEISIYNYDTIVNLRKCRKFEHVNYYLYAHCRDRPNRNRCNVTQTECIPCHCDNNTKCDQDTGACVKCAIGYIGSTCMPCNTSRYGINCTHNCNCFKNYACDVATGDCGRDGCAIGFTGSPCMPCNGSRYGINCTRNCNCFKNYACDLATGDCGRYGCAARWTGDSNCLIQIRCDHHKWGKKCIGCGACKWNCKGGSSSCKQRCARDTGVCGVEGCLPNFIGIRCDVCVDKMYGRKCEHNCGKCLVSCDVVTGHCHGYQCWAGYMGKKCDIPCEMGRYGVTCLNKCSTHCVGGRCSFVDGSCLDGCDVGWTGTHCTGRVTCIDQHRYGPDCVTTCHNCIDDICSTDGSCIRGCIAGYWSSRCRVPCPSGRYGRNCEYLCGRCADWDECDTNTGKCSLGCLGHFDGDMCTVCPIKYFGPVCDEVCGHCKNEEQCDRYTGVCDSGCRDGFHGYYCEIRDPLPEELDSAL